MGLSLQEEANEKEITAVDIGDYYPDWRYSVTLANGPG